MTSIIAILPVLIVEVITVARRLWATTRIAGAPLTSPVWTFLARDEKPRACSATARAPRSRVGPREVLRSRWSDR